MLRINLLPKSKRPSIWPAFSSILLAAGIIFFLLSVGFAAFNYYQAWNLKLQIARLEQQKLLMKQVADHSLIAAKKERAIALRIKLLANFTSARTSWNYILTYLSDVIPPGVWLTEISSKNQADEINKDNKNNVGDLFLTLKGKALAYPDIAAFIQKLAADERFVNPVLVRAEKVDSFEGSQFEIRVRMKRL